MEPFVDTAGIADEDVARARLYRLLARLMHTAPDAVFLTLLRELAGDPSDIGQAFAAVADAAAHATPEAVDEEFTALFIGLPRGEFLPCKSYYMTGFLHEKPLAELRDDLARMGIASGGTGPYTEDHIASLCEVMDGLIEGAFGAPAPLDEQRRFFNTHLAPWAPRFFAELQQAESARFYRAVGRLGHLFMAVEQEAFSMA